MENFFLIPLPYQRGTPAVVHAVSQRVSFEAGRTPELDCAEGGTKSTSCRHQKTRSPQLHEKKIIR